MSMPGRYRRVEVLEHDPSFAARAEQEGARIRAALAESKRGRVPVLGEHRHLGDLLLEVHHIGSTALPIPAKPLLDLLLVVRDVSLLDAPDALAAMQSLSYRALGEYGIVGRRLFSRSDDQEQPIQNLHAFTARAEAIERHLD